MRPDKKGDYEVGYGKPPRHTRFKRGRSGNPRGRHPGSRNLSTVLSEALNEPVIVAENGGRRKISKREAIIKQLVNQSAQGDWRAAKLLLDILQDIERRTEPEVRESSFGSADEKVIEQLKVRLRGKSPIIEDLTRAEYEALLRQDFAPSMNACPLV
jgi:hypothetical protein